MEEMREFLSGFGPNTDLEDLSEKELIAAHTLLHSLWKEAVEHGRNPKDLSREEMARIHDEIIRELEEQDVPKGNFNDKIEASADSDGSLDVELEMVPANPLPSKANRALNEIRDAVESGRLPPMIAHRDGDGGLLIRPAKPEEIEAAVGIEELRQSEKERTTIDVINPAFAVDLEEMR